MSKPKRRRAEIGPIEKADISELISREVHTKLSIEEAEGFQRCLRHTTMCWGGRVGDDLICIWGIVPPALMSDTAYLWLYTTEAFKGNEFIFVRHSQEVIKEILSRCGEIVGHCRVGAAQSRRWLRWLGAEFGEPHEQLVPFVIRAVANG